MLEKFLQFFTPLLKEYNKRNEVVEGYTLESLQTLVDRINKLCLFDVQYEDNRELHVRLLGFIDGFINISNKKKLKDKHLKLFLDDIWYLNHVYEENLDVMDEIDLTEGLYTDSRYAISCIDKYTSLLLSKTIDYIPDSDNDVKKLKTTIDLFDVFKQQLHQLVESGLVYWVYPFTENLYYVPINLRYLDTYRNLGERITDWVEGYQETKVAKYVRERGYDVFAGWGALTNKVEIKSTEVKPKDTKVKGEYPEAVLKNSVMEMVITNVYRHMFMYIHSPTFDITRTDHLQLLIRSITICISHHAYGYVLKHGAYLQILRSARILIGKNATYRKRRDRKYWLLDSWVKPVKEMHEQYNRSRVDEAVGLVSTHALDVSVPSADDWDIVLRNHHGFLARSHNRVYYGDVPFTDKEIAHALDLYQHYLMPRYFTFVPEDRQWFFRASLEMWLNIRDEQRVEELYKQLKGWFGERHPTELNQEFMKINKGYFLFLSYHNKKMLLDKLTTEPFEIVNYGRSQDVYDEIIEICRRDVVHPITEARVKRVEVESDGVTVG